MKVLVALAIFGLLSFALATDSSNGETSLTGGENECSAVQSSRQGIVNAALWTASSGKYITYSEGSDRWSGIEDKVCPYQGVPATTDCSAFVTWIYWSAFGNGPDFINGENWTAGYTGTMSQHGTTVSEADAQPGDVVLYGTGYPYYHATILVSPGMVVSFGEDGPALHISIDACGSDYIIKSYLN